METMFTAGLIVIPFLLTLIIGASIGRRFRQGRPDQGEMIQKYLETNGKK